jgi:hypothetical protein
LYAAAGVWKDFTRIAGGGIVFAAKANKPSLGSVSGTEQGLYASGTAITVTATPAEGYSFLRWAGQSGTQLGTSPTLSLTLTQDNVLTAHFGKAQTVNLTAAGTLKGVPGITRITHLTLTGSIDARDVQFMRDNMPLLLELDLEGASVVAYSGAEEHTSLLPPTQPTKCRCPRSTTPRRIAAKSPCFRCCCLRALRALATGRFPPAPG